MKMNENDVVKLATKILQDIRWAFDESEGGTALEYPVEKQIEELNLIKGNSRDDVLIARLYSFWSVIFDFPEDDGWDGRNVMRVKIKDETGEPYEVGHRQWKGKVLKDENGKYYKEDY
jgi:hypothetical protein